MFVTGCCRNSDSAQRISNGENRIVIVTDYGAKANGRTDDTKAIQRAINHAAKYDNSTVYFPKGTYLISRISPQIYGCLEVPSNITLEGALNHESVLKMEDYQLPGTRMVLVREESNVVFRSISFDGSAFYKEGNIVKRSQDDYYKVKKGKKWNEQLHSIFIKSSHNVIVEDCHFANSKGDGVYITGVYSNENQASKIVIRNNVFHSADRNGISLGHGFNDVVVDSNIFYGDNIHTAMVDSEPIFETGESYVCSNLKITNNKFLCGKSSKKRVDVAGSIVNRNILIENNIFENVELHLVNTENATVINNEFTRESGSNINSIRVRYYNVNLNITDNIFTSDGDLPLIQIEGYSVNTKKADKSIEFPYPKKVQFVNNKISLTSTCLPISLQTVKDVVIQGNTVSQTKKAEHSFIKLKPYASNTGIEDIRIEANIISNFDYLIDVGTKAKGEMNCISVKENNFDGKSISQKLKLCQDGQNNSVDCKSNCFELKKK